MRRFTTVLAVAATLLLTAAAGTAVAGAAPVGGPSQVNTFVGTSEFQVLTPACSFVHQTFDATYGGRRHPGSFHLDGCVTVATLSLFTFQGTFVITAPDGRHITGTVTGQLDNSSYTGCALGEPPASLTFAMTPIVGTRAVAGSPRAIDLAGVWCGGGQDQPIHGTFALAP